MLRLKKVFDVMRLQRLPPGGADAKQTMSSLAELTCFIFWWASSAMLRLQKMVDIAPPVRKGRDRLEANSSRGRKSSPRGRQLFVGYAEIPREIRSHELVSSRRSHGGDERQRSIGDVLRWCLCHRAHAADH